MQDGKHHRGVFPDFLRADPVDFTNAFAGVGEAGRAIRAQLVLVNHSGHLAGDLPQPRQRFLLQCLRPAAFGHILENPDGSFPRIPRGHSVTDETAPEKAAVFALHLHFRSADAALSELRGIRLADPLVILRVRIERRCLRADTFFHGTAQEQPEGGIGPDHLAVLEEADTHRGRPQDDTLLVADLLQGRFRLFAAGDIMDDGVEHPAAAGEHQAAKHLHIANRAIRHPVPEFETPAVLRLNGGHGLKHLLLRERVELGDPHLDQPFPRVSIELSGSRIRVEDLSARGVNQQHHRGVVRELAVVGLLVLPQPVQRLLAVADVHEALQQFIAPLDLHAPDRLQHRTAAAIGTKHLAFGVVHGLAQIAHRAGIFLRRTEKRVTSLPHNLFDGSAKEGCRLGIGAFNPAGLGINDHHTGREALYQVALESFALL